MVKKLLVLLILISVLIPFVLAYDLSDFPEPFIENNEFNFIGVVGSDADVIGVSDIFVGLSRDYNITIPCAPCPNGQICTAICNPITRTKLDDDVKDFSENMISVGGPCANKITAQIMDLPTTWPECAAGFENGTGIIKLYNKWNKTQIIVAGYSAEDTRKTAKVIITYNTYNLSGYEIKVIGDVDNPNFERIITEDDKDYCKKDEDCVKARGDCCGCSSGGTATAINKDFYAEYEKGLGVCGCVAMVSTDISCFAKPICLNHKCTLDYNDYTVCEGLDYYNDWCYWQFATINNNTSLCEKISHDEPNVKPSISKCKDKIQK